MKPTFTVISVKCDPNAESYGQVKYVCPVFGRIQYLKSDKFLPDKV